MEEDGVVPFQRVKHYRLVWVVDEAYQCRTLLKTVLDGPDYESKSFPWLLKLGQSTDQERKGISLFIKAVNLPKEVLVRFHVRVTKQTTMSMIYLLDKEYEAMFGSESVWESPLLVKNDDFKTEPPTEMLQSFWNISVELIWNEKVEAENLINQASSDVVSELLSYKELGANLKQFFRNGRFSDIFIRCGREEIFSHKAILEARCPYFARAINSYSGGNWEGQFGGLSPTKDIDVMNALLMYLYTGDIGSLMENGPLPIGIYTCASRMREYDLEWITSPFQAHGCTYVKHESIQYEWFIDNFCGRIKEGDQSLTIRSESFGNDKTAFTLHIKPSTQNDFAPSISVFLQLDELKNCNDVYVIFILTIKNGKKFVITNTTGGDLTLKGSIGFSELVSLDDFFQTPDAVFCSKIFVYKGNLSTRIEKVSQNCVINPDKRADGASPMPLLGYGSHGWINLSNDLGDLLMTAKYSDCTIVVGGYRLLAHRVILAARSPYFSTVFSVKEEECEGSSRGMEIFLNNDLNIGVEMMKIILKEIYTGSYKIEDSQLAKDIYEFAKFFGLRRLEIKCSKFFEST